MKKNLTKLATVGVLAASVLAGTAVATPATASASEPTTTRQAGVETAPEFGPFDNIRDRIRRAIRERAERERRERIERARCERRPGRHVFVRGECRRVFGGFGNNRNNDNDGDGRGDRDGRGGRGGFDFGNGRR